MVNLWWAVRDEMEGLMPNLEVAGMGKVWNYWAPSFSEARLILYAVLLLCFIHPLSLQMVYLMIFNKMQQNRVSPSIDEATLFVPTWGTALGPWALHL